LRSRQRDREAADTETGQQRNHVRAQVAKRIDDDQAASHERDDAHAEPHRGAVRALPADPGHDQDRFRKGMSQSCDGPDREHRHESFCDDHHHLKHATGEVDVGIEKVQSL